MRDSLKNVNISEDAKWRIVVEVLEVELNLLKGDVGQLEKKLKTDGEIMNNGFQETLQQLILAQAQLTTAQATLANTQTLFLERMAHIEGDLEWIKTTLVRHEQMLQNLPEAVRLKIGFQGQP